MPTTYLASSTRTNRFLGRCEHCIRPIAVEDADTFSDVKKIACPDCGTTGLRLERVYGTIERMACDGRCEGAIGPVCVCSCGGANHGGRFLQTGEALISAIMAYRQTTQRRRAAAQVRSANRAEARAEQERARISAYRSANETALTRIEAYSGTNDFLCSIREQSVSGRELSERQISSALVAIEREMEREMRMAQERANAQPAVIGSGITIDGRILSVRVQEGQYGTEYKMLVADDRGFKVWSTVPTTISREVRQLIELQGRRVMFVCNTIPSRDDETFCIAKRPRSGRLLPAVEGSSLDPL